MVVVQGRLLYRMCANASAGAAWVRPVVRPWPWPSIPCTRRRPSPPLRPSARAHRRAAFRNYNRPFFEQPIQRRAQFGIGQRQLERQIADRTAPHMALRVERVGQRVEMPRDEFTQVCAVAQGLEPIGFELRPGPILDRGDTKRLLGAKMVVQSAERRFRAGGDVRQAGTAISLELDRSNAASRIRERSPAGLFLRPALPLSIVALSLIRRVLHQPARPRNRLHHKTG